MAYSQPLPKTHLIEGLGPVVREALALVATLALGVIVVTLLIYAPPAFLRDDPLTTTNIAAYFDAVRGYLAGLLRGNIGVNERGRPITGELLEALRRTLELLGVSLAVALPLGLLWGGALANMRRGAIQALLFGLSTVLTSLPTFVVLLLAVEMFATMTLRTGVQLALVQGYGFDKHLVLPVTVLALRGGSYMARAIEVAQDEIMRQDWIRAARAKGLSGFGLWRRHVLPALGLPILGSALGMLRLMVGGLVIVDYLYNWGGLGRKLLEVSAPGIVSSRPGSITAGAAVLLVCLFVGVDAVGRMLARWADPQMRAPGGAE